MKTKITMKARIVDVTERTLATFGQAFLAVVVVQGNVSDVTALKVALAAGGLATAKYLLVVANNFLNPPPRTSR